MGGFNFVPDDQTHQPVHVPYYEDARADVAPYKDGYRSWDEVRAQAAVSTELGKLGGMVNVFRPGHFMAGQEKRYGYVIEFAYSGVPGRIVVAGLPTRADSIEKQRRVRIQALLNVRDWLKAAVTARTFNPESDVLMQYLLVDGERTFVQVMYQSGKLPMLTGGS